MRARATTFSIVMVKRMGSTPFAVIRMHLSKSPLHRGITTNEGYHKRSDVTLRLVPIREAAHLLGMATDSLRQRISGRYAYLEIGQLRVYRLDERPGSVSRFDADEIRRLQERSTASKEG